MLHPIHTLLLWISLMKWKYLHNHVQQVKLLILVITVNIIFLNMYFLLFKILKTTFFTIKGIMLVIHMVKYIMVN